MRNIKIVLLFFWLLHETLSAQNIAINTSGASADPSAMLDLNTGNTGTKGFLPEQVVLTATNVAAPVSTPATGLLVYNTNTAGTSPYNVVPGYYYWNGTLWVLMENTSKCSVQLPYVNINSALSGNFYTSAYTPCSTAPATPCSGAYNFPLINAPLSNLNSIASVTYWGTYNNSFYTLSSNGNFSRACGWINSGTTGTVTIYAYVYTLTNNSTSALAGAQIASTTVTISNSGTNYFFEIPTPSTPYVLAKGQMIILWYYPSVNMTNLKGIGMVEVVLNPQ